MKVLIQRVTQASVTVDGKTVGKIGPGLLVFLGIRAGDEEKDIDYIVNKIAHLRLFESEKSGFDRSVLDEKKPVLLVSQFTLYASCKKGRRPDFGEAAKSDHAREVYEKCLEKIQEIGLNTASGTFQAHMKVELINDGPVTIMVESPLS